MSQARKASTKFGHPAPHPRRVTSAASGSDFNNGYSSYEWGARAGIERCRSFLLRPALPVLRPGVRDVSRLRWSAVSLPIKQKKRLKRAALFLCVLRLDASGGGEVRVPVHAPAAFIIRAHKRRGEPMPARRRALHLRLRIDGICSDPAQPRSIKRLSARQWGRYLP